MKAKAIVSTLVIELQGKYLLSKIKKSFFLYMLQNGFFLFI